MKNGVVKKEQHPLLVNKTNYQSLKIIKTIDENLYSNANASINEQPGLHKQRSTSYITMGKTLDAPTHSMTRTPSSSFVSNRNKNPLKCSFKNLSAKTLDPSDVKSLYKNAV